MYNFNRYLFCLFILFFSTITFAAAETYKIDPKHTYVSWKISHFDYSQQTGKWYANGTLTIDKEAPENSQVEAKIQVADVITGIPDLDKHLKDKEFFDVKKFPTATFTSNKVEVTGGNSAKVYGTLNFRGVSKPIVLNVTINKTGMHPMTKKMTVGFNADTKLKRSDFGMNAFATALGDEVDISISGEAMKVEEEPGKTDAT